MHFESSVTAYYLVEALLCTQYLAFWGRCLAFGNCEVLLSTLVPTQFLSLCTVDSGGCITTLI